MWIFIFQKYCNFWSISLGHFIKHKPFISEEWQLLVYSFFFVKKFHIFWNCLFCRMLLQFNWDLPLNHQNQLKKAQKQIHFFTAPFNVELNRPGPNMKWELTFANTPEKWLNPFDLERTILDVLFVQSKAKVAGPCIYTLGPIQGKSHSNVHFAILLLLRKKVANGTYNPNIANKNIFFLK